jgi:hypothetical protein
MEEGSSNMACHCRVIEGGIWAEEVIDCGIQIGSGLIQPSPKPIIKLLRAADRLIPEPLFEGCGQRRFVGRRVFHLAGNRLNQIFQFLFQELSSTVNPSFDRTFGRLHDVRYLLITEFLLFEQEDCGFLVFRELFQSQFKGLLNFLVQSNLFGELYLGEVRRVPRFNWFALCAPVFVYKEPPCDLEQKGAELGDGLVIGGGPVEPDKDRLGEVLGNLIICKAAIEKVDERGLPARNQLFQGLFPALTELKHPLHGWIFVWWGG